MDFGFSDVIVEEQGFKTFTTFHGTPVFSSDEMFKLLGTKSKEGFVDLYENDLICFELAKDELLTD